MTYKILWRSPGGDRWHVAHETETATEAKLCREILEHATNNKVEILPTPTGQFTGQAQKEGHHERTETN